MAKILRSDLPPAYCTLSLSPEESAIAAVVDSTRDTEDLISNSFDKDARVIFTQKVLAIFLLQTIGVGVILGTCLYIRADFNSNFLWLVSMICWWFWLFIMIYADHIKNRTIYNYAILVCYPTSVAFVILTFPVLVFNMNSPWLQWELQKAFVTAWVSYIAAGFAALFYCIFSFDSQHEFRLRCNVFTSTLVFAISYVCICIGLFIYDYFHYNSLYIILFLYLYHLYVLYDIHSMTGSEYRCALSPADYVTGAVNIHIDFLFIFKNLVCERCCCDSNEQ